MSQQETSFQCFEGKCRDKKPPVFFRTKGRLRAHQRCHKKPFACLNAKCRSQKPPVKFCSEKDLKRHERSHDDLKPRCQYCDAAIGRLDNLQRHVDTLHGGGLCAAVKNNDQVAVQSCLMMCSVNQKAALEEKDEMENTPLIIACIHGHIDILHMLLEKGAADSDLPSASFALWLARLGGHEETANLLIRRGVHLGAVAETQMFKGVGIALKRGDTAFVQRFLDTEGAIDFINQRESALFNLAVNQGDKVMIELLIAKGANNHWSVWKAASHGHAELLHIMLEQELGPGWHGDHPTLTEIFDYFWERNESILRLVLDRGLDYDKPGHDGETQLHNAARRGRATTARLLIERGANIKSPDNRGRTPLHVAAACDYGDCSSVIELLLERGANLNAVDSGGYMPLHHANFKTFNTLLRYGADVNATTEHGMTPLHTLCHRRRYLNRDSIQGIAQLLEAGCDINRVDENGNTALHLCLMNQTRNHLGASRVLIENGADVLKQNNAGKSAVDLIKSLQGKRADAFRAQIQPLVGHLMKA